MEIYKKYEKYLIYGIYNNALNNTTHFTKILLRYIY